MNARHHVASVRAGAGLGVAEPEAHGFAALKMHLVDRIKRAALRHLHASQRGELMLLRMYHDAEAASLDLFRTQQANQPPDWLMRQIDRHLAEEEAHTALYAAALGARAPGRAVRLAPEGLSRRKLACWRRLDDRHARHFVHGYLVPMYATLLCAEQMAVRVMRRHCSTIGPQHALYSLFDTVLKDEFRHVRLCAHTLERLVAPHETVHLAVLLAETRKIGTAYGVCGAVALYAAGCFLRVLPARETR